MLESGEATRTPQDDALSTYAQKITKQDCLIDFGKDAVSVHNLIRGLSPIPLSFTHTPNGKLLKVISAEIADREKAHSLIGEVLSVDNGIEVACAIGSVRLLRVVPEGKSRMNASDFVRGRSVAVGDILS